jgi:hypothetical protein
VEIANLLAKRMPRLRLRVKDVDLARLQVIPRRQRRQGPTNVGN